MDAQHCQQRLWRGRRGGFTLIEIMITISIIALVASIAIPYFVTYRTASQTKACVSNLRQLEYAKEQWALETRQQVGGSCDITDLIGTDKYIKNTINCPSAGVNYIVGTVGDRPTCPAGLTNHVLP